MPTRKRPTLLIRSLPGLILAGLTLSSVQAFVQEPENPFTRARINGGNGGGTASGVSLKSMICLYKEQIDLFPLRRSVTDAILPP